MSNASDNKPCAACELKALAQPEQEPVTCLDHELLQLALDAILAARESELLHPKPFQNRYLDIIGKLETALAQPESHPVAKHVCNLWINPKTFFYEVDRGTHPINEVIPVYTAPPKREWVGLTDADLMKEFGYTDELLRDTAYRVQQKLKELNK